MNVLRRKCASHGSSFFFKKSPSDAVYPVKKPLQTDLHGGTLFTAVDVPKLQLLSSTIQTILSVLEFALASPDQPLARVADYTAGGESHPAPKNFS